MQLILPQLLSQRPAILHSQKELKKTVTFDKRTPAERFAAQEEAARLRKLAQENQARQRIEDIKANCAMKNETNYEASDLLERANIAMITGCIKNTILTPLYPVRHIVVESVSAFSAIWDYKDSITPERLKVLEEFVVNNIRSEAEGTSNLDPLTNQPIKWSTVKKGPDAKHWARALFEEIVRLVETTRTIHFRPLSALPAGANPTYISFVAKIKQVEKRKTYRVRAVLGGNKIKTGTAERSAPTASMEAFKMLLNGVVSDNNSRWATGDIENFYLQSTLKESAWMWMNLNTLTPEIIDYFQLRKIATQKGLVLVEVTGGMYGHPLAGIGAYNDLHKHLSDNGYSSDETSPCVYSNADKSIVCVLIVDDFAIKYKSRRKAEEFWAMLGKKYVVKVDWEGSTYNGFTIKFDYKRHFVDISMPGYVEKMLRMYHRTDIKGKYTPAKCTSIKFGAKAQMMEADTEDEPLTAAELKFYQGIVGSSMWYTRAVDYTGYLATTLAGGAGNGQLKKQRCERLLQYFKQFPNATVRFHRSDMILRAETDASYNSEPGARSRIASFFYFGNREEVEGQRNGAVQVNVKVETTVCNSAMEIEYVGCYATARSGIALRQMSDAMGYPQAATRISTDNACAAGVANKTMKIKRSRTINMNFHWIRDRVAQGEYTVVWFEGRKNLADFFTKPLPREAHARAQFQLVHYPRL